MRRSIPTSTPAERRLQREAHSANQRARALALRQAGATYAAIGAQLGVSIERARQIVRKVERLSSNPHWSDSLPARVRNFLIVSDLAGLPEKEAAQACAHLTLRDLLGSPNFGRVALDALVTWLGKHGFRLRDDASNPAHVRGPLMNEPDAGGACAGLKAPLGNSNAHPLCPTPLTSQAAGDPPSPFESLRDLVALGGARVILIDSPLAFSTYSAKGEGRTPQHHYRCLSFDELAALPITSITAKDAWMFSWVPLRSVDLVKPLFEAWDFNFSGSGLVWVKTNKKKPGFFMGAGYTTRKNVEISWLGRRGKPKRLSTSVRELIIAPRREHSRKPDEQYERIEQFCAGPYVELFARTRRAGWHQWGDELGCFV